MIRTASCPSKNQSGVHCVKVLIEGVPVTSLVDTGSDITIIRGDLFYKIAAVAKVEIKFIINVDQRVCTYDQKPMTLDGCIDMKITFGEKNIVTTVYIKLVAPDQLLLSEVACHLLGIVNYHPEVQLLQRPLLEKTKLLMILLLLRTLLLLKLLMLMAQLLLKLLLLITPLLLLITPLLLLSLKVANADVTTNAKATIADSTTIVKATTANDSRAQINPMEKQMMPEKVCPNETLKQQPMIPQLEQVPKPNKLATGTMQVRLIRAVRIPANCSAVVPVQVKGLKGLALLEPKGYLQSCLNADESLVEVQENGSTTMLIVNNGTLPYCFKKNTEVAQTVEAELLHKLNGKQELSSDRHRTIRGKKWTLTCP